MKVQWQKLSEGFNAYSQRERIILGFLLLAVIYALFELSFFSSAQKEKTSLRQRMDAAQLEMKKISAQELVLAQALSNDPSAAKQREIEQLELRSITLEQNLQKLAVGLIPAEKLPQALHDVLHNMGGALRLSGMETLAPSKLQLATAQPVDAAKIAREQEQAKAVAAAKNESMPDDLATAENVGVYKHAVLVSLEGRYFDVVRYLQALEALPWRIYWQRLDYEVSRYPQAKVLIEVYTLSTDKGVLGV